MAMLTAEQIEARRERVGASEIAAIFGVPTFVGVSAWTVWADKCGILEPRKAEPWLDEGNRLEPFILNWAERELGALERNVVVHDPDGLRIAATLDGRVVKSGEPVEAKTSGIFGPIHGHWGEAGTDEVPDGYVLQCQTQLRCTKARACHLFALLGGRGRVEYVVHPEPRLIAKIGDVADDFYTEFVLTRRDPRDGWAERLEKAHGVKLLGDPCSPTLEVAKRIRRTSGKTVQIENSEPFEKWAKFRDVRLEAQKAEETALAACLAELGDADAAQLPGGLEFSYREQRTADTIDREAMKAAGVYERFATPNTCRVARMKGLKKKGK